MDKIQLKKIKLIGISLKNKTTNANEQSAIDCGNLWQTFEKLNISETISNKLSDEIFAVYYDYEGDYTQPFSYFIGCKVAPDTFVCSDFDSLLLPEGNYIKITAAGKMPDCISNAWKEIWKSDIRRSYIKDFEVYGDKSKDWNNAEVEIFISIKE